MTQALESPENFNAAVKADPKVLNNKMISHARLSSMNKSSWDGVRLENLIVRNLTLRDVEMRGAKLKNVTFVDCKLIKTDFSNSRFENVKFIRGSFSGYHPPTDSFADYQTDFARVEVDRLLLDGVHFGKSVKTGFRNGIVVLRNITTDPNPGVVLGGSNLQVRMDNCTIQNQDALGVLGENSTAYITNSRFIKSDLDILKGRAAWVENCDFSGSSTPSAAQTVVTNCRIGSYFTVRGMKFGQSRIFLSKNTYGNGSVTVTYPITAMYRNKRDPSDFTAHLFIDGRLPRVFVNTGKVHIYDAEIGQLVLHQNRSETFSPLESLNLSNVTVKSGDWERCDVEQGLWENVRLHPKIDVNEGSLKNITGHKVSFPEGSPWVNGSVEITESPTPLNIERPPVPTLEELGLAQFWRENDFPPQEY
jgi:uncharacterized protein YjbI with pentapeptide repeats